MASFIFRALTVLFNSFLSLSLLYSSVLKSPPQMISSCFIFILCALVYISWKCALCFIVFLLCICVAYEVSVFFSVHYSG